MCYMTSAAASSPIDSMTTADFSTSLSCGRLLEAASVTGYPAITVPAGGPSTTLGTGPSAMLGTGPGTLSPAQQRP